MGESDVIRALATIQQGILSLRHDFTRLQRQLDSGIGHFAPRRVPGSAMPQLEVSFDELPHRASGRSKRLKPTGKEVTHRLRISGIIALEQNLSAARTATLVVLFLDQKSRLDHGGSPFDVRSEIEHALSALGASDAWSSSPAERARVNLRRVIAMFRSAPLSRNDPWRISVTQTPPEIALEYQAPGQSHFLPVAAGDVDLQLRVTDSRLTNIVERLLPSSYLEQIKRRRAQFVPGGPAHFDELFLELFDHSFPVVERSMYYKPSITTYPVELLDFLGVSEPDKRRQQIMHAGFRTHRCRFVEILNITVLEQMMTVGQDGSFVYYGPGVMPTQVASHFRNLMSMLREFHPQYQMVIAKRPLPFLLSTFRIQKPLAEECFTVFFRQMISEHDPNVQCFVLYDSSVAANVEKFVFPRVMAEASTISGRDEVIELLAHHVSLLEESGPLITEE